MYYIIKVTSDTERNEKIAKFDFNEDCSELVGFEHLASTYPKVFLDAKHTLGWMQYMQFLTKLFEHELECDRTKLRDEIVACSTGIPYTVLRDDDNLNRKVNREGWLAMYSDKTLMRDALAHKLSLVEYKYKNTELYGAYTTYDSNLMRKGRDLQNDFINRLSEFGMQRKYIAQVIWSILVTGLPTWWENIRIVCAARNDYYVSLDVWPTDAYVTLSTCIDPADCSVALHCTGFNLKTLVRDLPEIVQCATYTDNQLISLENVCRSNSFFVSDVFKYLKDLCLQVKNFKLQ